MRCKYFHIVFFRLKNNMNYIPSACQDVLLEAWPEELPLVLTKVDRCMWFSRVHTLQSSRYVIKGLAWHFEWYANGASIGKQLVSSSPCCHCQTCMQHNWCNYCVFPSYPCSVLMTQLSKKGLRHANDHFNILLKIHKWPHLNSESGVSGWHESSACFCAWKQIYKP